MVGAFQMEALMPIFAIRPPRACSPTPLRVHKIAGVLKDSSESTLSLFARL
jgi:hypothetical protein